MSADTVTVAAVAPDLAQDVLELYENAPAAYIVLRAEGTILSVNQTLARWTGFAKSGLQGRRLPELLSLPSRMYFETHVSPRLAMGGSASEIALDMRTADGGVLALLMNAELRPGAANAREYRVTLFNATERRRFERELVEARRRAEAATRMKSHLMELMGHDISTPLNAILGVVHLLDTPDASPRQRRLLGVLRQSADNLTGLIDDIVKYIQLDGGAAAAVVQTPFSVRALIESAVNQSATLAAGKNVQLRADVASDVPQIVRGDAAKISDVLLKLIGVSFKFTSAGTIDVTVRHSTSTDEHSLLEFAVTDTGVGFEREHLRTLLEDFSESGAAAGLEYGGAGLRLAISRRLLRLLGGELSAHSVIGQGTTFSFSLRLHRP